MGKRMRVDGMHTWSFPSGLLHIQTIYWMCPPRKRSFIASCFAGLWRRKMLLHYNMLYTDHQNYMQNIIYFMWAWRTTIYSRHQDQMKYLAHKQKLWMSKENKSNPKLFSHRSILTDQHMTSAYNTYTSISVHNTTVPTHILPAYWGNRVETGHCSSPVCPPETDYLDQSAKWLDLLGTLEWPSTSACQASRPVGLSPSESTH